MNIAAVVILYHPGPAAVENIRSYYHFVDKIYVFDNTEVRSNIQHLLNDLHKVEFFYDGQNLGIAARLNTACQLAQSANFDWLLTMDQDTYFEADDINQYMDCFFKYNNSENVAQFGVEFRHDFKPLRTGCNSIQIDKLITSGSLLNLSLFTNIGGFDENLFIDAVDYDYCFRARILGYKLIQFTQVFIQHNIGNIVHRSSIKTLFLKKKRKVIHSPVRCYYMLRNMLYLKKKYKNEDSGYIKQIEDYVWPRIKTNIYYGRQTAKLLKMLLLAYRHAKKLKMGKLNF